jgi:hypothetical protein
VLARIIHEPDGVGGRRAAPPMPWGPRRKGTHQEKHAADRALFLALPRRRYGSARF